jgi:hypothetical protein
VTGAGARAGRCVELAGRPAFQPSDADERRSGAQEHLLRTGGRARGRSPDTVHKRPLLPAPATGTNWVLDPFERQELLRTWADAPDNPDGMGCAGQQPGARRGRAGLALSSASLVVVIYQWGASPQLAGTAIRTGPRRTAAGWPGGWRGSRKAPGVGTLATPGTPMRRGAHGPASHDGLFDGGELLRLKVDHEEPARGRERLQHRRRLRHLRQACAWVRRSWTRAREAGVRLRFEG